MVGHCDVRGSANRSRFDSIRKRSTIISSIVLVFCLGVVDVCAAYSDVEVGDSSSCLSCKADSTVQVAVGHVRNSLTGETRSIPVHREVISRHIGADECAMQIKYTADISLPLGRGTYTSSKSRVDPSVSYRLTLTQYYSEMVINGWPYVSVSKYKGTWQRLDSQVAASDGDLSAAVRGWLLGGGTILDVDQDSHIVPGSYSTRTFVPDWAGTYINMGVMFGYQCGQIAVELYRRNDPNETWEFWVIVCQGETIHQF